MSLKDFHTHNLRARDAIVSVSPQRVEAVLSNRPGIVLSTGIHPWDTEGERDFELLERMVSLPQVVAVGETGLDKLRGADMKRQMEIFRWHVVLSERLSKPLIVHCVKAWEELLQVKNELKPSQPWGVHGFRGGPQLASQLLEHGFYISLGEFFNRETARIIPSDRLLIETDESSMSIEEIECRVLDCRIGVAIEPEGVLARFLCNV